MQVFPSRNEFKKDPIASALLQLLEDEQSLELAQALVYRSFPLYRDDEGALVTADCVLVSPWHGVFAFALTSASHEIQKQELTRCLDIVEQIPSFIHSRLIKNRGLRSNPTTLAIPILAVVFGPLLESNVLDQTPVARNGSDLHSVLLGARLQAPLPPTTFEELVATLDGAKGLIRPKRRELPSQDERSKGKQAEKVEAAITLFDQRQKHGIMGQVTGPQRIRGLAGSGKTVVLAMKAAQTHLRDPDATIAFTFYTKSLYQHVKRLITRFYRQFDDRDPDWDKLQIMHGWGSASTPGLYAMACAKHDVRPLSYQEADARTFGDSFDYVCTDLLKHIPIEPLYDYIFIDEGQDFPLSFMRLCYALAKGGKFTLAYDDLQTIFQARTPSAAEIFGEENGQPKATFEEDVVLHKCYRNPRELLVTAHALGFGLYGPKIVQMLESQEHWEDIGYIVREGEFKAGSRIKVERPQENSLPIISDLSTFDEIVKAQSFETLDEEVSDIASDICDVLKDGLKPEDLLVVSVDDRNSKEYLRKIERALFRKQIASNNLHDDSFGIRDFSIEGRVTLSTVHKAKGNEAFMVYVVGVNAVMGQPDVKRRNMLFTALTRAKGWVSVSGCGQGAANGIREITKAKDRFPYLIFKYPTSERLKVMKRDLEEAADRKLRFERLMDELGDEYTPEEISALLEERRRKAPGRQRRKNS